MSAQEDDPIELSDSDRATAHGVLDRWLDECQREGIVRFETGCSGYFGRMKLYAFVDDNGITLRVERSFEESL